MAQDAGGFGLHVYAPLHTPVAYERTKAFARLLEGDRPDEVTSRMPTHRAGRVSWTGARTMGQVDRRPVDC